MNNNKITKSQRKEDETECPLSEQKKIKINRVLTNVLCSLNLDLTYLKGQAHSPEKGLS